MFDGKVYRKRKLIKRKAENTEFFRDVVRKQRNWTFKNFYLVIFLNSLN